MTMGTLYGIGVGPGDPEWMTVKAVRILSTCRHVFVPKSSVGAESVALEIAKGYLHAEAIVHEQPYPMTADQSVLKQHWQQAAREVHAVMSGGENCCFLTLGDALLYSTYIYLLRELRGIDPQAKVVTVPGITAFSAAAALTNCTLGEGKQLVTIVPAADDFSQFTGALDRGGTVVLMKIGSRLNRVLDELDNRRLAERAVFVFARRHGRSARRNRCPQAAQLRGANRLSVDHDHSGRAERRRGKKLMKVYFVGAGPGDPDLLTVKAKRLLESARRCIYAGSLVNPALLNLLPTDAERHDSAAMNLEQIVEMFEKAKADGVDVVRLHTGEPSIYGAIGEQMDALDRRGIAYEVVPGISAFQAAASALQVELTAPEVAQTIILTRAPGRTPMPESENLATLAASRATLCIYLSTDRVQELSAMLTEHYGAECPAALVYHASWPDEKIIRGTLADIAERIRREGITRTAIFLVGYALSRPVAHVSKLYDKSFAHGYRQGEPS